MSACEGFSPLGPQGSPLTAIGPAPSPAVFFFSVVVVVCLFFASDQFRTLLHAGP